MSPELSRLLITIYDAATNPELWPVFYREFSALVKADFVGVQAHCLSRKHSQFLSSYGQTREFSKSYQEHYSRLNIRRERGKALFQQGEVVRAARHTPDNLLVRSEFYNDFLRPVGLRYSVVGVISRCPDTVIGFSVNRTDVHEDFDESDAELIKVVLPHLAKATSIQQRLAMFSAGETLLNRLTIGIIFLTGLGEIVFANRAAERLFRDGDGILAHDGRIAARDFCGDTHLQAAIEGAGVPPRSTHVRSVFLLNRPVPRRPLQALAFPMRGHWGKFEGMLTPALVLLVTDPDQKSAADPALLESLLGLTPSESRVACLLLKGRTTAEIASDLKIQENTVRAHLKAMFSKTTTRNQSELVAHLLTYSTDPASS